MLRLIRLIKKLIINLIASVLGIAFVLGSVYLLGRIFTFLEGHFWLMIPIVIIMIVYFLKSIKEG